MSTILISLDSDLERTEKLLNRFSKDVRERVVKTSLSKMAAQAKTQAATSIKDEYKINVRTIKKALNIKVGSGSKLEAAIEVEGKPLPLYAFGPRAYGGKPGWPKRGKKQKHKEGGVSVKIKGKRIKVPHAFIATMKSGHKGVFARGSWSSGKGSKQSFGNFKYDVERLPIQELKTFSLPQAFSNKVVYAEVVKVIRLKFPKILEHEIEWTWSKHKS